MIEKLIIHRFRGIYKGHLGDFARFNLLVGPNNTGKSAVLEMLYLCGVCGRECGLVVEATEDRFTAAAPLENDFLGFNPCSRLWARHGEKEEWENPPAALTEDGTLVYRLPLDNEDFLREFRLVPPPRKKQNTGVFPGKIKKVLPPLPCREHRKFPVNSSLSKIKLKRFPDMYFCISGTTSSYINVRKWASPPGHWAGRGRIPGGSCFLISIPPTEISSQVF